MEWTMQDNMMACSVNLLMDLHIWAVAASSLAKSESMADADKSLPMGEEDLDWKFTMMDEHKVDLEEWEWSPPDLSMGGAWHTMRVKGLEAPIAGRAEIGQL